MSRDRCLRVSFFEPLIAGGIALWAGQRQGDLLRLPWSAYAGDQIRLRQSKTGRAWLGTCAGPEA